MCYDWDEQTWRKGIIHLSSHKPSQHFHYATTPLVNHRHTPTHTQPLQHPGPTPLTHTLHPLHLAVTLRPWTTVCRTRACPCCQSVCKSVTYCRSCAKTEDSPSTLLSHLVQHNVVNCSWWLSFEVKGEKVVNRHLQGSEEGGAAGRMNGGCHEWCPLRRLWYQIPPSAETCPPFPSILSPPPPPSLSQLTEQCPIWPTVTTKENNFKNVN